MRLITNEELLVVAGGFGDEDGGDWEYTDEDSYADSPDGGSSTKKSGGGGSDQRNQSQKNADEALARAKEACSFLQFGCVTQAERVSYYTQSEAYNICKAEGGEDGPNGCGKKPTPPKK